MSGPVPSRRDAGGTRWVGDLVLGIRLAIGGGRMSRTGVVRLVFGTVGVGLAVAILLVAASVPNIMQARETRTSAQEADSRPRPGVDPLEISSATTVFHGESVRGYLVRATGPNVPLPPGVDRIPGPGEIVVSPALAKLLTSPEGELLRPRFPHRIVGTIADEGVVDPHRLSFYAGVAEPVEYMQQAYAFRGEKPGWQWQSSLLTLLMLGLVVLLVPVFLFVGTSARIAGAQRDRRLAAMRLVGADARQVRRISAAESLVGAGTGLLLGAGLFLVFRAVAPGLQVLGLSVYSGDVTPSWWLVALIVLAVPALSVFSAVFALRHTVIEPLGVVRMARPVRRRLWWRLVPFVLGATLLWLGDRADREFQLIGGATLLLLGVPALLPWLLERAVARLRGGPPSLQTALRRLQLDSGTPARVVAGVAVVLAGAIALQTGLTAEARRWEMDVLPTSQSSQERMLRVEIGGGEVDDVAASVRGVPGVRQVYLTKYLTSKWGQGETVSIAVADCETLRVLAKVGGCSDGDVFLGDTSNYSTPLVINPGQTVSLTEYDEQHEPVEIGKWTLPAKLSRVGRTDQQELTVWAELLATPGAFARDKVTIPANGYASAAVLFDRDTPDALEQVRNAGGPISGRTLSVYEVGVRELTGDQQQFSTIRSGLLAGSLFTLLLAGVSLLVLTLEQMRERRRPFAMLTASGVPIGTLARSLLWQNAVPVLLAVIVALGAGLGLGALVARLAHVPFTVDWASVGLFSGAAAALVFLVTVLTLPTLRGLTRLNSLRTE